MNNYQWLLQMDGAERKAWFDAEHVEHQDGTLDGDTAAQNADSRERLEADAFAYLQTAYITYPQIIKLLDRQAAITERECLVKSVQGADAMLTAECAELQAKVDELTAERDKLKGQVFTLKCECDDLEGTCNVLENDLYNAKAERERYREKFGKCLDYADAIHALMDDEGMA